MTPRNNSHRRHVLCDILQVNPNGQNIIIGMGPELDILMPLHRLATATPFEVEF